MQFYSLSLVTSHIEKIKTEQPLIALKEAESLSCSMGKHDLSVHSFADR